jgi:Domain of unknown function (DUF5664)
MNTVELGVIEPLCKEDDRCIGCLFEDGSRLTDLDGDTVSCASVDCHRVIWVKSDKIENPKTRAGSSKVPYSNIPSQVLTEVGAAMHEGATKYGAQNFRAARVSDCSMYNATMRHLQAHLQGQDIDEDSGTPHLTKAIASLFVWRDAYITGMIEDDRPPIAPVNIDSMNELCVKISERNAKYNPKNYTK